MSAHAVPEKETVDSADPMVRRPWVVILYNDEVHTFDEVIRQLQKATGCSEPEATRITMEAHFKGKAVAFQGGFTECMRVIRVLREIALVVEIQG